VTDALAQLDRVRSEAVERAQRTTADTRAQHDAAREALTAHRRQQVQCERALARARQDFADAQSVPTLRAAERQLTQCEAMLQRARATTTLLEQQHEANLQALRAAEQALRTAELGRRAVGRRLAQRSADVGRRTELASEAEAEDAFRSLRPR
jgi:flagellar biosynthesis chaperone FliJ